MTTVVVRLNQGKILSLEASGHTGYAESGEDVVCAALSAIVQTAALGLERVLRTNASVERRDEDGYFKISLDFVPEREKAGAEIVMRTALCGIADLADGYPDFIKLEVK